MEQKLLDFYKEYKNKVSAFELAINSIYFDQATIAPKDGALYANEMLSILSGESFTYSTSPDNIKKLEQLHKETDDTLLKKELTLRLRELHQISLLPKEVYVNYQKAVADSEYYWKQAKEENNYDIFKPYLITIIKMRKDMLSYFAFEGSKYDYLLDQFEIGMNEEKYDTFFNVIKEKLVPLIHKIQKDGRKIDNQILLSEFDIGKQKKCTDIILKALNVNSDRCYITESMHPFTSSFSINDVRITTNYMLDNFMFSVLSTIHEYGHALYGLQVNPEFEKTLFFSGIGMAMHESQSRFLENHVGRNLGFWTSIYPDIQDTFKEILGDISVTEFMDMMNVSTPSLIRIKADELTYPLHILIRYELEKEMFNGDVDYDSLDTLWADKYEKYLGVRPTSPAEGILQDMHWSGGLFGYFPTYALGSAFAAQFYHGIEKEMNVEVALKEQQFEKISSWLKQNIHQYGASKTYDEILLAATGETFNPTYYIDYLVAKYTKLYNL